MNAFYAVYDGQRAQGGGIPDATGRLRYAPVLSPRLNKQLMDAAAAQARLTAKVKNAVPPMLEGDIFSSLFEGATTVSLGACSGDASRGQCVVNLGHADPNAKPIGWSDTIYLIATPGGWRVDDIGYGASWDFGNKGRLSETVRSAIADAAN